MAHKWITSGPRFWVTRYLQSTEAAVTTETMWRAVQEDLATDIIPSKTHLKRHVLKPMFSHGSLKREFAVNPEERKRYRNAWVLVPDIAFQYVKENPED